jgi:RluA family pseudouridine synthase
VSEPEVDFNFQIEYEDDNFLLVNKPGNLPCHPAGPFFENTLWRKLSETHEKVSIVNRLDRETSGLTIAAKSPEAASKFSALFSEGKIEKKYIAIVFGSFPEELEAKGFLTGDISSEVRKKRKFVYERESPGAETALTFFRLLGKNDKFSVVEAAPKTGRLHQIRATLCSLGFPLAGDKLYGPDDTAFIRFAEGRFSEEDKALLALPRQALHAYYLSFIHPFTGKEMKFEISAPDDILPLYLDCMGV